MPTRLRQAALVIPRLSLLLVVVVLAGCSAGTTAMPTPAAPAAVAPAASPSAPPLAAPSSLPGASLSVVPVPSPSSSAAAGAASGDVTVFAAASLTDVFNDVSTSFTQANPQAQVTYSFASSGTLATQLSQGAKADVFAAADQTTMNAAKSAGAIVGSDQVFAENSLIVITPTDNPAHITSLKDLANPGVTVVTADTSVPIGQYTQTMLQKASQDPTYGPDFQAQVQANIVSQQTDDRQIVAAVQTGNADAAVVYATDVTPATQGQLNSFPVPAAYNTVVQYPIAVAKGDNLAGGQAFVAYVLSSPGQAILAHWGFLPPST